MELEPYKSSAVEIAAAVRAKKLDPEDVARFFADRVEKHSGRLGSHLHFAEDDALAQAKALKERLARGEELPLAGVPVVVKDNICTKDAPTTCASRFLEGYVPPYDAHVTTLLRDAGALLFGKANMDEFAMGSSGENSGFRPTANPWDESRVPGGSSSGSAAAVAADLAPLSLGSDTGGSIRQPASFCGIYGLKPTYGRVSRFGLVAFASSLDQIGPFARSIEDLALLFDVIAGHDPRDSTSARTPKPQSVEAVRRAPEKLSGLRVGVIKEGFPAELDQGVRAAVTAKLERLKALGAQAVEVSLPTIAYGIAAYYVLANAEASANLARFDGVRYGKRVEKERGSIKDLYRLSRSEGFGREVKQRIMLGTFALSSGYYDAYYGKAQRARNALRAELAALLDEVDVLALPTAPSGAFPLGAKRDDPLAMYMSDVFTIPASLAGLPALSLPAGLDQEGLPVGLQLIGRPFEETRLFEVAKLLEREGRLPHAPLV